METQQKESMKRIRRHSQSVLQDLHLKEFKDEVKDVSIVEYDYMACKLAVV